MSLGGRSRAIRPKTFILQPRDRLLIHRNPDAVEPATVYIQGEVGKPGRYPLTTNMTVADLIRVGGGLKPERGYASGRPDALSSVSTRGKLDGQARGGRRFPRRSAGDPKANVPLHNGDVVTIRQLPGWNDLGASITVKGEVKHPGTYGIRPGERLSSVIAASRRISAGRLSATAPCCSECRFASWKSKQQDEMILRVKEAQSNLELTAGQRSAAEASQGNGAAAISDDLLTQLTANPPVGACRDSDFFRHRSLEKHAGGHRSAGRRHAGDSEAAELRDGDRTGVQSDGGFLPAGQEARNGTSANRADRRHLANKKAIFVIRADGSVMGGRDKFVVGKFAERGAAAGRYRGGAGEGDRRRDAVAGRIYCGAGRVLDRKHGVHRGALLMKNVE